MKNKLKKLITKLKKNKIYGIIAIILLIILLALLIDTSINYKTKTTKFGLDDVGELVTQTAYLTVVQDTKVNRDFFKLFDIPFTESRQIFSYDIQVDASVDFSKIKYEVKNNQKQIIVSLPHAKIYKTTLDTDSLNVYLDNSNIFSRIDLKKHNEAVKEMEKQGEEDAKENGILEAADENAKKLIEGFIKSNKEYKEYKLTYKYIG